MKLLAARMALCLIALSLTAQGVEMNSASPTKAALTPDDVRMVAPALEKYTQERVLGELWKRPGLSPRDRSIVTLAVLITRNQTVEMPVLPGARTRQRSQAE